MMLRSKVTTLVRFVLGSFLLTGLLMFLFGVAPTAVEAATIVVTNNDDNGSGSLRQAIWDANPEDVIEFAPALSGQTITLQTQLDIPKSLTIRATVPITISGNPTTRVFEVTAGNVTFDGLTIANGNGGQFGEGGGIRINEENMGNITAVTIQNSTLVGNYAGSGGAIYANTQSGSCSSPPRVFIRNSTLSDNSASVGGALFNFSGVVEISHSTITLNTGNMGGGVLSNNTSDACTRVGHSIISGNSNDDVAAFDSNQRFSSLGHNLIGTAGNNVDFDDFNQTGDQTGVTDPRLSPLADNGGLTRTHALLRSFPVSPAIDGGAATCPLPTDQRGSPRPKNGLCDIGAYEFDCTMLVTNTNSNNTPGSLTNAVSSAPFSVCDSPTIQFDTSLSGQTISPSFPLEITFDVTIQGNVPITISAANSSRAFNILAGNVTLDNLTIANGNVGIWNGDGAGVSIAGPNTAVTITNSTLTGNSANYGGGIYNNGTLTVANSALSGNTANNRSGGGIYNNNGGTLTVNNSALSGNSATHGGGGIFNNQGALTVEQQRPLRQFGHH
jgi:hypothetical protein